MLTHLTIIETDQCAALVQENFDSHQEQFRQTLFITINPYHSFLLNELGLTCILPHALLDDHDHLTGAQQVTKWMDQFEANNAEVAKKPFGESILFENIFYAQFLLGHGLFLFLLAKKAKEKYPKIDQYLRLRHFKLPSKGNPFLQNEESFAPLIESLFKVSTVAFPQNVPTEKLQTISFFKKIFLKFACFVQWGDLKQAERILKKQKEIQPIMVYHHRLLYNWVLEKNKKTPWLLKISSDEPSWVKIISMSIIPLWQNLLPASFERWTEKQLGAKYSRIIDLHPFSFQKNSNRATRGLEIEQTNDFKFSLNEITFDLKAKFSNGILKHSLKLEKCFSALIPFLEKESFKTKVHFYNIDNTGLSGILGDASAQYNLNSTLITHGSHPKHNDPVLIKEFLRHGRGLFISRHKYTAVQSEIAKDFAQNFIKNSTPILTGPVAFGKISGKINPGFFKAKYFKDKNILLYLHAGTYKPRGSFRFLIYETVDEYVSNIQKLIKNIEQANAASSAKKIKLIVKIRPTAYLDLKKLKSLLIPSPDYVIDDSTPFLDLVQDSDGVISFSSTTLEEALLNNKSIFLLKRKNFSFFESDNRIISNSLTHPSNFLGNL